MAKLNLLNKDNKQGQDDIIFKSNFNQNYDYRTESDDEEKYINKKFQKFYRWPKPQQKRYMIKLWKMAFN